jgi:hypothetical protein
MAMLRWCGYCWRLVLMLKQWQEVGKIFGLDWNALDWGGFNK